MQDIDQLALAVLNTPQVDAARRDLEELYAADKSAQWPLTRQRISAAVGEYAFAAAQSAASDPARPMLNWRNAYARRHAGLNVPSGRFGTDNPDNAYMFIGMSGEYSYRIDGQLADHPPCIFTYSLLDGDYVRTSHIKTQGLLGKNDLVVDADGRFTITIDASPADGRPNHIQSTPDTVMLNLRETLADWTIELPAKLSISRTDGKATPPAHSVEDMAVRAASYIREGAPFWALKFHHESYEKIAPNQPQPIMSSAKRLGGLLTQFSSHGSFTLEEDEAYVVRVDPFDADYVGFQLADAWMVSADYVDRLGSLNNRQVVADADGRISYVISRRDPGAHNWLDAGGMDVGGTTIRFQGMKDIDRDFSGAFEVWHGKIADLRSVLPAETTWVDAAGRAEQIRKRVDSYRRRERALMKE